MIFAAESNKKKLYLHHWIKYSVSFGNNYNMNVLRSVFYKFFIRPTTKLTKKILEFEKKTDSETVEERSQEVSLDAILLIIS